MKMNIRECLLILGNTEKKALHRYKEFLSGDIK